MVMEIFLGIALLGIVSAVFQRAGQKKRLRDAYRWNPPNIKGEMRFATDRDLKGKLL